MYVYSRTVCEICLNYCLQQLSLTCYDLQIWNAFLVKDLAQNSKVALTTLWTDLTFRIFVPTHVSKSGQSTTSTPFLATPAVCIAAIIQPTCGTPTTGSGTTSMIHASAHHLMRELLSVLKVTFSSMNWKLTPESVVCTEGNRLESAFFLPSFLPSSLLSFSCVFYPIFSTCSSHRTRVSQIPGSVVLNSSVLEPMTVTAGLVLCEMTFDFL